MQRVLQELPWKHDNGIVSDLIVFLDDNFAEIFKWDGLCLPAELGVYSLHNVNNRIIGIYRRVVVFTTALDMQVINDILLATEKGDSCECHILTSVPAAMVRSEQFGKRQSGERIGYSVITSILNSVHTTVTYLPMHVVGVVRNSLQVCKTAQQLALSPRLMHKVFVAE